MYLFEKKTTKALNLTNVAGIFYTLFVGLLIGVMVVLAEVLYKSFKYSKSNQVSFGQFTKLAQFRNIRKRITTNNEISK